VKYRLIASGAFHLNYSSKYLNIKFMNDSISSKLSIFICLVFGISNLTLAQTSNSEQPSGLNTMVGFHMGPQAFQSDSFQLNYSQSPIHYSFFAGIEIKPFLLTSLNYQRGQVNQKQQLTSGPSNFKSDFHAFDVRFTWISEQVDQLPLSFFVALGAGLLSYNTFSDRKASNGDSYHFWKDGSIRNLPESPLNSDLADILTRDFIYETPLRLNQRGAYFPLHVGTKISISHQIDAWAGYELRVLEKTRSLSYGNGLTNDRLQRLTIGVSYTFRKKETQQIPSVPESILAITPLKIVPEKPVFAPNHFDEVDFDKIMAEDEDGDGVPDYLDSCLQTPKGWLVNTAGCPPDSDGDGIADQFDKEPDSKPGAWVDAFGVTVSDAFLQEMYNDSISFMVEVLRKVNRNSRPYPVKRFISQENFIVYAEMLEENPSWRPILVSKDQLPQELRIFDKDNNGIISLTELIDASDLLFSGNPSMSRELYFKACEYVFRTQN